MKRVIDSSYDQAVLTAIFIIAGLVFLLCMALTLLPISSALSPNQEHPTKLTLSKISPIKPTKVCPIQGCKPKAIPSPVEPKKVSPKANPPAEEEQPARKVRRHSGAVLTKWCVDLNGLIRPMDIFVPWNNKTISGFHAVPFDMKTRTLEPKPMSGEGLLSCNYKLNIIWSRPEYKAYW